MRTAKLFQTGRSQAVRLPKEFRFEGDDVYIKKVGDMVIMIPYRMPWKSLIDSLELFSSDFMENREQPLAQERQETFE